MLPVSAFVARREVMDVFTPGSHGSTFGGNPLAAAVGPRGAACHSRRRAGGAQPRARRPHARAPARDRSPALKAVRGRGLWVGAEIDPASSRSAREACERLLAKGVLSKETHDTVVRLAPPLVIARDDLDWALDRFEEVLRDLSARRRVARILSLLEVTLMTMLDANARFLMCRPQHFAVSYAINPWMDPAELGATISARTAAARAAKWTGLHRALQDAGAQIELVAAAAGPARSRVHRQCRGGARSARRCWRASAIPSDKPRSRISRPPSASCRRAACSTSVRKLPEGVVLEGAGDCVWDDTRNLFWMGYGPRSDAAARHAGRGDVRRRGGGA